MVNNQLNNNIEKTIDDYFKQIESTSYESTQTGAFWLEHSKKGQWPELVTYAKYILAIPATSAPIERIFSVGGAILAPKRRKMKDSLFHKLIFIRCNQEILD